MHSLASRTSRQPLALALAESTGTTSEMPFVTFEHFDDLDNPCWVTFQGGSWVKPRTVALSPFGQRVRRGRIRVLRRNNNFRIEDSIVYAGLKKFGDVSPTASMCQSLSEIFRRAGLDQERDLRPSSITFWAGRQAFDAAEEHQLEAAARAIA